MKDSIIGASASSICRSNSRSLRVTDHETSRVVAIHRRNGEIVGAGCLLDKKHILTCLHVVEAALEADQVSLRDTVLATVVGVEEQPTVRTVLVELGGHGPENDLPA